MDGLEAPRITKADSPSSVIVVLSAHADELFVKEARKGGGKCLRGENESRC